MRPLRLVILLTCFIALPIFLTFFSLVTAHPRDGDNFSASSTGASKLRALFSFQTPASLFPPSAMISLTDDNTTFFIAKPADFGPSLPGKGLNGQLWIGMGFGEDVSREDGVLATAEGELGCSDVPGWDGGSSKKIPSNAVPSPKQDSPERSNLEAVVSEGRETKTPDGAAISESNVIQEGSPASPAKDDGTDDYLHHPLPESGTANIPDTVRPTPQDGIREKGNTPAHADIQSLQEGAEIAGKIVLLSRGGCGFLEKVKWAQRRGAVAVIVGDNARHGSLLTMYGRGDTSNITIPSVFTSHTTAHLLSSLMPPERSDDPKDNPTLPKQSSKPDSKAIQSETDEKTKTPVAKQEKGAESAQIPMSSTTESQSRSWVRSLLHAVGLGGDSSDTEEDTRRPPSSGSISWVLVEDFEEEDITSSSRKKSSSNNKVSKVSSKGSHGPTGKTKHDDFVIGEQDWRDPDLLKPDHKLAEAETQKKAKAAQSNKGKEDEQSSRLKGGSITPGSGQYSAPVNPISSKSPGQGEGKGKNGRHAATDGSSRAWFSWLRPSYTDDHEHAEKTVKTKAKPQPKVLPAQSKTDNTMPTKNPTPGNEEREGLWVTLTPTSMSTSPFLDTLLVLVVSPLVTLTVVYGMLLLRSRIRRRRWRAPKSVVDRLPVRTYHTMSSSAVSSQLSSPEHSSPTTPLLRASATTRTRPRSRTASSVPTSADAIESQTNSNSPPEKPKAWRRRYNGRQVECVVCLEEYVDGQSRVMSLPCGHEFHAECITPWLTTRRRTCPICKGDVVRSMAQMGSSASSDGEAPPSADDVQELAAETRNDSPSAAIPIPRGEGEDDEDLERAADEDLLPTASQNQASRRNWRNVLSLSALSGDTIWAGRQTPVDRNR